MSPSRAIAIELLQKYPNAATMTLAKKAYKEAPSLWPTLEGCRGMFRRLRGASGGYKREHCAEKRFYREPQSPGDPFARLPEPLETVEKWEPLLIDGPARVGVMGDQHIPYHDPVAIRTSLSNLKERNVDLVLLNGDVLDCFAVSFWETDPRNRHFKDEIEAGKAYLGVVRETFPKARIVFRQGNHEDRFVRYMRVKAPELLDVPDFQLESLLGLDALGIELVKDASPVKIGALHFLHGHEHKGGITNPVNPARGLFLRAKVSCVVGHFHQTSQHSEPDLEGKVISTWGVGCLCNLHPQFMPLNRWNLGFMFAEIDKHGGYQVDNLRVIDGKPWH